MKGKLAVFTILLLTIIILILGWVWLQGVIDDYDIDRALSETINDII